jgi:hypothetical protein
MYALVYLEFRYVGAFVVLLWAGILSSFRLPSCQESKQFATYVSAAILLLMTIGLAADSAVLVRKNYRALTSWTDTSTNEQWQIASGLKRLGIRNGDKVGFIGYSFGAYWARLAGIQIVADMPAREDLPDPPKDVEYFWTSDQKSRREAIEVFRRIGVKAIVTDSIPVGASLRGWESIGDTGFHAYLLQ